MKTIRLLLFLSLLISARAAVFTFDDSLGNNSPYSLGALTDSNNTISLSGSSITGGGLGSTTWAFDFTLSSEKIVTGTLFGGTNVVSFTNPQVTAILYDLNNPFGYNALNVNSNSVSFDFLPGTFRFAYSFQINNHNNVGGGISDPVPYTFGSSLTLQDVPEPASPILLGLGLVALAGVCFRRTRC
jgi:hypothetical protein